MRCSAAFLVGNEQSMWVSQEYLLLKITASLFYQEG